MQLNRALEQQIAVFGESGSGKTVMLSSFYGATQEPQYLQQNPFHVIADDIGQGSRLHRNYLGMRDSARLPMQTRFTATSYTFTIKLQDGPDLRANRARPFDALRLVWHDYPGEWFTEQVSRPGEAQNRVDAFRSLLGSDVALLLVDGQRLLDNTGSEERYLRSLFANIRNGLLSLKPKLLDDGKPLVEFPRIWVIALSKSDLLPDMDVIAFRDLVVNKAGDDIEELRKVLASMVADNKALSVGEDLLLLSSAKFGDGEIEVGTRVGLELVLPLAAMLPFERHVRWAQAAEVGGKVAENLLGGANALAIALIGGGRFLPGPIGKVLSLIRPDHVDKAVMLVGDRLRETNAAAAAKRDHLTATLTRFRLDLDEGEGKRVFLRSKR